MDKILSLARLPVPPYELGSFRGVEPLRDEGNEPPLTPVERQKFKKI